MDVFHAKLTRYGLPEKDIAFLHGTAMESSSVVEAREDIVDERNEAVRVHILLEGWACQYRLLQDGRRQIGAIHPGGDICDLDTVSGGHPTFNVLALTKCRVGTISRVVLVKAISERPAIRDMLFALLIAENKSLIDHIVNLGRRSARERTAGLLCYLLARMQENGEALDGKMRCPLTQTDMADHLGLSTVHTNRALKELKDRGLIAGRGNIYDVCNGKALQTLAGVR